MKAGTLVKFRSYSPGKAGGWLCDGSFKEIVNDIGLICWICMKPAVIGLCVGDSGCVSGKPEVVILFEDKLLLVRTNLLKEIS